MKKDRLYVSANFIAKSINGEISVDVDNKIIKIKSPEAIVINVKDSKEEFEKNYPFLNRALEKSFSENYNFSITSTSLIDIKNCEDTLKSFVDSSNIFLKYDTYGLINAKNGYANINIYNTVNEGILDSENESSIIVHQNSVYKKFSDNQWYMFDKDDNYKMPLFSIDILTKTRTKELFSANIKKIIVKEVGKNKIYYLNLNQKEFNSTIDKMVGGGIMSKILTASLDSESDISIKDIKMQLMVNEWGQINASHFEAKISVKNDVPSLDMNLYFSEDGRYYDYGIKKDVEIPQIQ